MPPDYYFCKNSRRLKKLSILFLVAVIGISNGFIPTMFNPEVTYVETSGNKLGKLAFVQMLARLRSENVPENVIVESLIVKGGSL